MNTPGTIIGLSLLCALLFSAWTTPNATAAELATTAFTCKAQPQPDGDAEGFSDEHCTNFVTGKSVNFEHQELLPEEGTEVTATNSKTAESTTKSAEFVLTGKVGALSGEIGCTSAHMEGVMSNLPGPPMQVYTEKLKMSLWGCTTKGSLAAIKCKLFNEEIFVRAIVTRSIPNTMEVVFDPEEKHFAAFAIEGCSFKGEYFVDGTPSAIGNGATLEFTKESTKELTMEGVAASLTGQLTVRMRDVGGKVQAPISTTTKFVQ